MTAQTGSSAPVPPAIAPELLALLVCPIDKADLRLEGQTLVCTRCGRTYPIEDGIPSMLVEDIDDIEDIAEGG